MPEKFKTLNEHRDALDKKVDAIEDAQESKEKNKEFIHQELEKLADDIAFKNIADSMKSLLEANSGNIVETEEAIKTALNEVSDDSEIVKAWLVKEFRGRFGLNFNLKNGEFVIEKDEKGNWEKNGLIVPQNLIEIPNKLRDPNYSFKEYKKDIQSLQYFSLENFKKDIKPLEYKENEKVMMDLFKKIDIDVDKENFSEKEFQKRVKDILEDKNLEKAFEQMKATELEKADSLEKAGLKAGMVLTKEQRDTLNLFPNFDVEGMLKKSETMEIFREKFAEKVYRELKIWYDAQLPKSKTKKTESNQNKPLDIEKTVRDFGDEILGRNFAALKIFPEHYLQQLKTNLDAKLPCPLKSKDIKKAVNLHLEGVTKEQVVAGFNNNLETIDSAEESEFMAEKLKTIGDGYQESEWAGKYETYVKKTGPAAMDFHDWINVQKVPLGEKLGAMFRNILGPLMKAFKGIMGKETEKEILNDTEKKIKKYEKDAEEWTKEKEQEYKQRASVKAILENPTYKGTLETLDIKGLRNAEGKLTEDSLYELLKGDFENNVEFFKKTLEATNEKDAYLQLSREKGLKFETLVALKKFNEEDSREIVVDGNELLFKRTDEYGETENFEFKDAKKGEYDDELIVAMKRINGEEKGEVDKLRAQSSTFNEILGA